MKIVEAIFSVARRYAGKEYGALTPAQKLDALNGLNSAMMEVFRLLPQSYRVKTLHLYVNAPDAVSLQVTDASNELGNSPFTTDDIGRTVIAQGDAAWHQVGGENLLKDAWIGSTGTVAGTMYDDYIYGEDYPFECLISTPVLIDAAESIPLCLVNDPSLIMSAPNYYGVNEMRSIGRPRYYWTEPGGVSQGGQPVIAIRLRPIPDRAFRIQVKASYWPRRVLWADIEGNPELPIPDVCAESFIQLAGPHLVGIPGWNAMPATEVNTMAVIARDFCAAQPPVLVSPRSRVFTPRGF